MNSTATIEHKSLFAKTLQAVTLLDTIKLFFATSKEKFFLSKKSSSRMMYDKMFIFIMRHNPRLSDPKEISKMFAIYGINGYESFNLFLINHPEEVKEAKLNTACIRDYEQLAKKETALEKATREYIEKYGKGIEITIEDESEEDPDTEVRTVVIRSMYGDGPIKMYKLKGKIDKKNQHNLNVLKYAYHLDTGIKYAYARPILLSTWVKLPEEYKSASCPEKPQDDIIGKMD